MAKRKLTAENAAKEIVRLRAVGGEDPKIKEEFPELEKGWEHLAQQGGGTVEAPRPRGSGSSIITERGSVELPIGA